MSTSDISPQWRGAPEVHQAPGSFLVCYAPEVVDSAWTLFDIRSSGFTNRADLADFFASRGIDPEDVQSRGIIKRIECEGVDFGSTLRLSLNVVGSDPSPANAYNSFGQGMPLVIDIPAIAYIHQFWIKVYSGASPAYPNIRVYFDCPTRKPITA